MTEFALCLDLARATPTDYHEPIDTGSGVSRNPIVILWNVDYTNLGHKVNLVLHIELL